MTHEIVGAGSTGRDGHPPQPKPRKQQKLLATSLLNLSIVAVLTAGVVFATDAVPSTIVLIVYFVPVLLATLLWNFEQGVIAAFAGALFAEFFYFEPRFSFNLADRRDVMAVLIYLAAALLSGYLVDEIRRVRRAAAAIPVSNAAPERPALNFGGPTRTVPERIAEFLVGHKNAMYCDQCIQDQLGLKWRQQVQLVTATLAVTRLFERDSGQCQNCNQYKQVIRHIETR